jgi:ArsR family transcriptional regulator
MREKVELFKVLSEPNRIRILMMLMQKSLCVCEITSVLKLSTPTVSNHLSYLRKNGFIDDEKDGKWINYKVIKDSQNPIVKTIINSLPGWFSEENIIKQDLSEVLRVSRYAICGSEVVSINLNLIYENN